MRYCEIPKYGIAFSSMPMVKEDVDKLVSAGFRGILDLNDNDKTRILVKGNTKLEYSSLKIIDNSKPISIETLEQAVSICTKLGGKGKVLVNCTEGRGRSPAVVAYYLVKVGKEKPENAIEIVRKAGLENGHDVWTGHWDKDYPNEIK